MVLWMYAMQCNALHWCLIDKILKILLPGVDFTTIKRCHTVVFDKNYSTKISTAFWLVYFLIHSPFILNHVLQTNTLVIKYRPIIYNTDNNII